MLWVAERRRSRRLLGERRSERSEPLDTRTPASGAIKHVIHSVVVRQLGQATHQ